MKLKHILFGAALLAGVGASAHDFSATVNGQRLYFDITNKTKKTAAVTYQGSRADKRPSEVAGVVEIPAKVKHGDVVYEVTEIAPKAFADADRLQGIVIPAGVEKIGDFAFERCDSLKSVVFPGRQVSFGQGVFFDCPAIADVTLGSDWKTVDFTMFRWSDQLTSVSIPARIEKIQGVKKLTALRSIWVDPNNAKFSSDSGLLYSKDGATLYACPRAYEGRVGVRPGTVTVLPGALIDCPEVTSIFLPATVQSISFRETSRMKKLEEIALESETPVITGYIDGEGRFLFQLANPTVSISVKAPAKGKYLEKLATLPGEYSESPGGVPYMVTLAQLPSKKNIKGVKDLNKK